LAAAGTSTQTIQLATLGDDTGDMLFTDQATYQISVSQVGQPAEAVVVPVRRR